MNENPDFVSQSTNLENKALDQDVVIDDRRSTYLHELSEHGEVEALLVDGVEIDDLIAAGLLGDDPMECLSPGQRWAYQSAQAAALKSVCEHLLDGSVNIIEVW